MASAVFTFCPLSLGGLTAKSKVLVLGPASSALAERSRSLNIEHVSSAEFMRQEISRRTPFGVSASRAVDQHQSIPDQTILSVLRRWFWARKPDAGFVLADFPATLLQAHVFEEWLETRGITLDGVVASASDPDSLLEHYRTHGVSLYAEPELVAS